MSNLLGHTFNHKYKVIAILGEGGMGAVLKAYDLNLRRCVAIKVMHAYLSRQHNMQARFEQEAQAAARMRHPSIVQVYDYGQEGSMSYIVMEFISGDNLQAILKLRKQKNDPMPVAESVGLVAQLAKAVEYAHQHGVMHRDIKPANVMLIDEPTEGLRFRPVLTDLGLARLAEGIGLTGTGVSMGTPAYMSPEQAQGEEIDQRSDVYSLGILLFELCVGEPPFPARTISEAIRYHTKAPVPRPGSLRADIPPGLEDIVLKALEKDPADRYQNAAALAQALEELKKTLSLPSDQKTILNEFAQTQTEERAKPDFGTIPMLEWDSLQVVDEQGQQTPIQVKENHVIIVGRGGDCTIVVNDPRVSRQHVRIERRGRKYLVTDLGSSNGTYMGEVQLLSGQPQEWLRDQLLHIGNSFIRLIGADVEEREDTEKMPNTRDLSEAVAKSVGERVTIWVDGEQAQVEAGGRVSLQVHLLNHGKIVDHYSLGLKGIPESWVSLPERAARLNPGDRQTLQLEIHPPREPESRAGEHDLVLQVLSEADPEDLTERHIKLTIIPFYQYEFSIHPQKKSGVQNIEFQLKINNQCNTDLMFDLQGEDDEDDCTFSFEPAVVSVQPGQETQGKVIIRSKRLPPMEGSRVYSFKVITCPREDSKQKQQVRAEWEQRDLQLEMEMNPPIVRSSERGLFNLHLINTSEDYLQIKLDATSDKEICRFAFRPEVITIPSQVEAGVQLLISPIGDMKPTRERNHTFTVRANLVGAEKIRKERRGEWVQLPVSVEKTSGWLGNEIKKTTQKKSGSLFWAGLTLIVGWILTSLTMILYFFFRR